MSCQTCRFATKRIKMTGYSCGYLGIIIGINNCSCEHYQPIEKVDITLDIEKDEQLGLF